MNLRDVVSEFELNPAIKVDDQFVKERIQALFDVEQKLEESRLKEASGENAIRNLSDTKRILEQIEGEYATKSKETESRMNPEIEHLSNNVEVVRKKLAHIARMKTGLFTCISKKDKAQKELEATERLKSAENTLARTIEHFTIEQKRLRDEYLRRKQIALEQIRNHEKEIENLNTDSQTDRSIEARRHACETLVNAVNRFSEEDLIN
jgi:hypothetical protein